VSATRATSGRISEASFDAWFAANFDRQFARLFRYLDRLSGDAELAADVAQEAVVRLYQRRSAPDAPDAWLVIVATNLLRNAQSQRSRRLRLLTSERSRNVLGDEALSPAHAVLAQEDRCRARRVIEQMPERDARMLLLMAEGYSYRDIALALGVNEGSVGTLLARAKRAFRGLYEGERDAP
jgi:RNA polymerase sigma factor (sigma-70 family)